MAISSGVVSLFSQLQTEGFFDDIDSVMEFGAQEMRCLFHAPVMKKCLERFDRLQGLDDKKLGEICNGPSRNFFEALGMDYACVDTSGEDGALVFDLNFDSVADDQRGKFDLLTNFGTAEHVFNQYNAFKAAHDFVRKGGAFMHFMPFLGYVDHGYYSFQPCFYNELAAANDYDILGMWLNPHPRLNLCFIPWKKEILDFLDLKATNNSGLFVLMRKNGDGPFKPPFQGRYEKNYEGEFSAMYTPTVVGGEMGIVSRQALMEGLSAFDLQRVLVGRYLRKAKQFLLRIVR